MRMRKEIKDSRVTRDVLASFIAEDTVYKKKMVVDVLDSMLKHIRLNLIQGNEIVFPGFFTFKRHKTKASRCFNPVTKKVMERVPQYKVKLKVATDLKRAIKSLEVNDNE